jgi:hypothetical protein
MNEEVKICLLVSFAILVAMIGIDACTNTKEHVKPDQATSGPGALRFLVA